MWTQICTKTLIFIDNSDASAYFLVQEIVILMSRITLKVVYAIGSNFLSGCSTIISFSNDITDVYFLISTATPKTSKLSIFQKVLDTLQNSFKSNKDVFLINLMTMNHFDVIWIWKSTNNIVLATNIKKTPPPNGLSTEKQKR